MAALWTMDFPVVLTSKLRLKKSKAEWQVLDPTRTLKTTKVEHWVLPLLTPVSWWDLALVVLLLNLILPTYNQLCLCNDWKKFGQYLDSAGKGTEVQTRWMLMDMKTPSVALVSFSFGSVSLLKLLLSVVHYVWQCTTHHIHQHTFLSGFSILQVRCTNFHQLASNTLEKCLKQWIMLLIMLPFSHQPT